ncbi:MAG: hypothetical protein LBL04_05745, partial [Bacteroidales bacterium]|nr:hypothetical protein [Bacteroidales bacterium]
MQQGRDGILSCARYRPAACFDIGRRNRTVKSNIANAIKGQETMKVSIRFFDDREVRAIWDDENSKWWFNVVDIVAVLNEQNDYTKANNYWRWLKRKFVTEQNQ